MRIIVTDSRDAITKDQIITLDEDDSLHEFVARTIVRSLIVTAGIRAHFEPTTDTYTIIGLSKEQQNGYRPLWTRTYSPYEALNP